MSKRGLLSSLRSGDFIIIPRGGRGPLRVPAFAGDYGQAADRSDPPRAMRKLLQAMVALKARAGKK
jgi:hypothetical protein